MHWFVIICSLSGIRSTHHYDACFTQQQKTCELSLLDSNLSQYSPHLIGFACWSLARKAYGFEPWPRHLASALHCSALEIEAPARDLAELRRTIESKEVPCPLLKKLVFVPSFDHVMLVSSHVFSCMFVLHFSFLLFFGYRNIDGSNVCTVIGNEQ